MRLITIGRLMDEKKRAMAYKIYNDETKKSAIIAISDLSKRMNENKLNIIGLKLVDQIYNTRDDYKLTRKIKAQTGLFKAANLDEINSKGFVIGEPTRIVVLGAYGFKDDREFLCVNGNCDEFIVGYDDFIEKVKRNEVVGARYTSHLEIFKPLNMQYYK